MLIQNLRSIVAAVDDNHTPKQFTLVDYFYSKVTGGECKQEQYPKGTDYNKQFENTTPTKQHISALIRAANWHNILKT